MAIYNIKHGNDYIESYYNKDTGFEVGYYTAKEMKASYPDGGIRVSGQLKYGKNKSGTMTVNGIEEDVYRAENSARYKTIGYVELDNGTFVAVKKDRIVALILLALLALLALLGLIFGIKYAVDSGVFDDETTTAKSADPAVIVVDAKGESILVADDNISETDSNFALPYVFAEGESYFIGVYDNEKDSDNWTFALNKATSHTVEVEETVEKEDGTTETVTNTVVHELTYIPATESTCQVAGHSSALYCKTCEKYLAGNHDYGVASQCVDKNADNLCDWCSKVLVEEEPVECDCDCHKSGITKFFFNFDFSILSL